MKAVFSNPARVTVEGGGRGGFPWEAIVLLLVLAAVGGVAHAVAPYLHMVWKVLAIGGAMTFSGVLSLAGLAFARWEKRRPEPEPQVLRWRSGERMRP